MKRKSSRELVAQLSALRHLARCSALRASAAEVMGPNVVTHAECKAGPKPRQEPVREMAGIALAQYVIEQDPYVGAGHESRK
jgi:hypothetical protein